MPLTIVAGAPSELRLCLEYDDTYNAIDFNPPVASASEVCSDTIGKWVYEID